MITFKQISFKNFLSVGNHPNTIVLNESASTLVIGKNGYGKSTMLDALTFSLFGKPFRNVTKPQLINSINRKHCVVEIEFDVDGKEYKVIRGMKPSIFEVWCSGVLLNQDASSKDYQKTLEQQILKLTYKAFTQVVILGSASFVPFMQLPALSRREVIENILDIRIFSVMNSLLKNQIQSAKDALSKTESSLTAARNQVVLQKKLIQSIQSTSNESIEKLQRKIEAAKSSIDEQADICTGIQAEILDHATDEYLTKGLRETYRELVNKSIHLEASIANAEEHLREITVNTICPTCKQGITDDHKHQTFEKNTTLISSLNERLSATKTEIESLAETIQDGVRRNDVIREKTIAMSTAVNTIDLLKKQIAEYEAEIDEYKHNHSNLDKEQVQLKSIIRDGLALAQDRDDLIGKRGIQDIAASLLKDDGIKTAIIREYLPTMNRLINHYLRVMDSYIQLELDENFNEVIKSRYRDEFTYFSFSEGEKSRINLAILFTWRQIARMKNSINTNLLIFDEIFDSSLDSMGTESFIQLLAEEGTKTNVFVITHKEDAFVDKFEKVLKINKKGDFSTISFE